jgi:DNA-binding transcriptional LysR family regulator
VELTDAGKLFLPKARTLVNELDDLMRGVSTSNSELIGSIRMKVPTTLGANYLAKILITFQEEHPGVSLNVQTLDRSVNPADEGFDIAIGALPEVYTGVVEEPLCIYPRLACASPSYLSARGTPCHPNDLAHHDCLIFGPSGAAWTFESGEKRLVVEGKSKFSSNNSHMLLAAAREGKGVAILAKVILAPALEAGHLVPILTEYPVPDLWLRAWIPKARAHVPHVRALLDFLKCELLNLNESGW